VTARAQAGDGCQGRLHTQRWGELRLPAREPIEKHLRSFLTLLKYGNILRYDASVV